MSEAIQGSQVEMTARGSTDPTRFGSGMGLFMPNVGRYGYGQFGLTYQPYATRTDQPVSTLFLPGSINRVMGNVEASGAAATPALQAQAEDVRFLANVLEPGRIPTLMASNRLARELERMGSAREEEYVVGRMAGAATGSSAAAAMRDFFPGARRSDLSRVPAASLAEATTVRRGSVAVVFARLRQTIQRGDRYILRASGQPLLDLGRDFDGWMRTAVRIIRASGPAPTEPEVNRLAGDLSGSLVEFLQAQRERMER